jgi:hypothetical protein
MDFKDWLKKEIPSIYDAYESFLDTILESEFVLDENAGSIKVKAEFVLEEAKKPKKEKPWGSERWLDSNSKIEKTKSVDNFTTDGKKLIFEPYLINLLPASQSGFNLCICATKECAATCLHTAGNIGALVDKTLSRLRKSWFMALDNEHAFEQIANQIANKKKKVDEFNIKSKDSRKQMIVRLNGTSDLIWRAMTGKRGNLFEMFPDIVFYDYSKMDEVKHFIRGEILDKDGNSSGVFPPNYHLTLSYGGPHGMDNYRQVLTSGENLAVPFGPGKTASLDYMEFPKDIRNLIKSGNSHRIYYPDHIESKRGKESSKAKNEYIDMIIDKIKENGDYVTPEELAPFAGQTLLPGLFMCHEVIDGDDYDARFLDDLMLPRMNLPSGSEREPDMEIGKWERKRKKHGIIVGLTAKGDLSFSAYKGAGGWDVKHTGFMVGPEDKELNSQCRPMLNDPSREAFLRNKTDVFKKVARALMTIRNFDARHVHARDIGSFGKSPRTHVQRGKSKPVQTYITSKGRTTREMNELIDLIHKVMRGENPEIRGGNIKKMQSVAAAAAKLRQYIMDPEVIKMLNDDEFKKISRERGISVNLASLAKLVDIESHRNPTGPKRTVLPPEMLRSLGNKTN